MKLDRNCGGVMPYYGNMGLPGPLPINNMPMPIGFPTNNYETNDLTTIQNQINALEKRVSNLESMINSTYSNSYNTTNYQMM